MKPLKNWSNGFRLFGWIRRDGKKHNGLDGKDKIKGWYCAGTQVYTTFNEEVIFISDNVGGFGSRGYPGSVIITKFKYGEKWYTCLYGHVVSSLKEGDKLKPGDIIGVIDKYITWYNGKEERADHIHFAVHEGQEIPPLPWGYVDNLNGWIYPNILKGE